MATSTRTVPAKNLADCPECQASGHTTIGRCQRCQGSGKLVVRESEGTIKETCLLFD